MFNIALVNHKKIGDSRYIEALKEKQCDVHYLESDELDQRINTMDAVIIKESSLEEIGETCELIIKIRSLTDRFIWILSEDSTKINRIVYLQLGSDGTFDDQVDPDEFGIYVGTTLERRTKKVEPVKEVEPQKDKIEELTPIELVPNNFSVNVEKKGEVSLTKLEFQAMEILVRRQGDAVSYEEMYQAIWGDEKGDRKYRISNLVFHLRKKLGDDPFKPKYIRTVRSRGYMLSM
ncbi:MULTISPECIES: winged helix-turn-helix domain-containing protein [unclassified Enterococcus]|uniref:winged helix-turn-helix domain-containing protein n=1 Tax=unclassified Enterococcus TaxID=2608891 RepID=UPI001CE19B7C|nr:MULTISPECIES: winged helix-turn-helix domain-containing protein [unclassified Enterococcus]MCA5012178.1 winged helix-turn-helix domain-containing protein [Enterococcus sp. S23]MCA5015429.1 winged helix-turn-helix domain-containing protein [Enterococcus sp. S22(2020)]